MINQVLIAGRLTDDPRKLERPGAPTVELQLEVERATQPGAPPETCVVTVLAHGKTQVDLITRYLSKGRNALVHGRLAPDGPSLLVITDRFDFMEDGIRGRPLGREPQRDPPPASSRVTSGAGPALTASASAASAARAATSRAAVV